MMPLVEHSYEFAPAAVQSVLDETIIRLVGLHDGIKDTHLTIAVLVESGPHIQSSTDPCFAARLVVQSIHKLIHNGKLIGVDCETPGGGFTLVLPLQSKATIAVPIFVNYSGTRH